MFALSPGRRERLSPAGSALDPVCTSGRKVEVYDGVRRTRFGTVPARARGGDRHGGTVPEAAQHGMDVTSIAPAERHTAEFEADAHPGIYLMHCHEVTHVTDGSSHPGGVLTGVVYRETTDTEIFSQLMEYAGFEA